MREYLMGLVTVTLFGSVILSLLPRSTASGAVKLLCGLCVICTVTFPLASLFRDGDYALENVSALFEQGEYDEGYYVEIYNGYLAQADVINGGKYLKEQVAQALGLDDGDFDLNVVLEDDSDEKSIERVEIIIYASGLDIDPHSVEKYISETLGCSCEVIYKM